MKFLLLIWLFEAIVMAEVLASKNPNFSPGRSVIVHLFEWKWNDIATECEDFLSPKGYGGVQVSPVTENLILENRPWFERYQPISYKLITRSGNETEFADMVRRCNAVGVRVYVDVVINHMCGGNEKKMGTAGTIADPEIRLYPAVPLSDSDFNSPVCEIIDFNNAKEVRNCELLGLRDLNHTQPHVRRKTIEFLNLLIDLGVAGFRVDAAKHMWPQDMKVIYDALKPLNENHGFKPNARPYIAQEVIDFGGNDQAITRDEYTSLGAITEFRFSKELGQVFRGNNPMHWLQGWGHNWSFVDSNDALVFVDNHDNQRGDYALMYRHGQPYRMAIAWALAHPYGTVRVMSSFEFPSDENDLGPPQDKDGNLISPTFNKEGGLCNSGWVCEHRWPTTANMVSFRNAAGKEPISRWWDNSGNQAAFSRGRRAFVAFNIDNTDLNEKLKTFLPQGEYCDIMSGKRERDSCTGIQISVDRYSYARIFIPTYSTERVIAIHVGPLSKLW